MDNRQVTDNTYDEPEIRTPQNKYIVTPGDSYAVNEIPEQMKTNS